MKPNPGVQNMEPLNIPRVEKVKVDESIVRKFNSEEDYTGLSLDLLIETGSYVCIAGNLSTTESQKWSRDEALLGGHIVRLYKLISGLLDQTCQHRREIGFILCRLAFECVVNLRYLIKHASPKLFESYIAYSLKHEKQLRDTILSNVKARGGAPQEIEQRMLKSIEISFKTSGLKSEDVRAADLKNWGGKSIYDKAKDLGLEAAYLAAFGGGSHNVHGNWQDLLEYHPETHDDGSFTPVFEWHPLRPQLLNVISLFAIEAIIDYLTYLAPIEFKQIFQALDELEKRILLLERLHEEFLSKGK